MMLPRSVVLGVVLAIGDTCLASAQEVRETPGPLEQQAKQVTSTNPVPQWTSSKAVEYPSAMNRMGRAIVTLQVTLDMTGRVAEIRKVSEQLREERGRPADADTRRKAGEGSAKAAVKAIRSWKFARPVDGPLTFPVAIVFVGGMVLARVAPAVPLGFSGNADALRTDSTSQGAPAFGREGQPSPPFKPPVLIKKVQAVYPSKAQAERVQGVVIVEALIGVDGKIRNVNVLRSVPLLDGAAEAATWQYEYQPPMQGGRPIDIIMTVTHTFTLN